MNLQQAQQTISDMNSGKIKWDDNLRAQANNIIAAGAGGNDPAVAMQQEIENDYKTQNDAYTKALSDYEKANPFSFDDMLAKETKNAKGNISPYYDQILSNYMKGVQYLKGNTIDDEQRALTKLQADYDAYTGQNKALLDTTMTQVGQDYGNAGSYDSGARARAQGIQEENSQYNQEQAERQYQYDTQTQKIQADRVINQQIPLQTTQEQEQIANQEAGDINTQAQQLAEYDQQKYNYLKQEAAVAGVPAVGKYGTANTIPGLSSAQTQQTLQGLLPNVQVSSFGGAQATPILGYS